ncbi:MAG: YceI family protein [Gammaproteobacteria bacterium]|nr:YceI family protein [Gammaproteobacteria bacterium]MCW8924413.1 YceI family protein [Gammaproteobacteria bacterium]
MNLKTFTTSLLVAGLAFGSSALMAADYVIDTKGAHAFIQFRVQHLGYSWLYGRFNEFSGRFSYDEAAQEKASIEVTIKTASVDSNHAERDKHLRSKDFLDVDKYPEAKFVSTGYAPGKDGKGVLKGRLTLHGVTKAVEIQVEPIGAGKDPWGGYRRGFEGKTKFAMADFGILKNLGPKSKDVEMILSIEGIRQ